MPHPDGRSSFYLREDVNKVRLRSIARAGQGPVAAGAMRWGEPVILTAITEMTDAGPRYRDRLAVDLARARAPFENVAELLWSGEYIDEPLIWPQSPDPPGLNDLLCAGAKLHANPHILQLMAMTVLGLGVAEGNRRDRMRVGDTPVASARRLIRAMAGTLGFLGKTRGYLPLRDGQTIAEGVAWVLGMHASPLQLDALNGALVLVADHELNPATFAARVAASGSVDLQSGVGAAIGTHYGTLVGRACDRIEQLFEPPADPDTVLDRATGMIGAARSLPGFNHPHYPHGDPRARVLIELAIMMGGSRRVVGNMLMSLKRLEEECGARPNRRLLSLPHGAAVGRGRRAQLQRAEYR
ncbi:MAG: citrate synthase [Betaproteobacteria bacterium]|nr:citrate synthase [Betaproteobacteria bacterium]